MSPWSRARLGGWFSGALLLVWVAEACSNSADSTALAPAGPASVAISSVEGRAVEGMDASLPTPGTPIVLGCDNTLLVQLSLANWTLRPPGYCGTAPQCGSVRVSLLQTPDSAVLATQPAATSEVQLDLTTLVIDSTLSQVAYLKAELFDDALQPYAVNQGGSAVIALAIVAGDCPGPTGSAGAAGALPSGAGASGASEGGASGASEGGASGASEGGASGASASGGGANGASADSGTSAAGAGGEGASSGSALL